MIYNVNEVHKIIGKYMLADGFDIVCDLDKSKGSYLYDSKYNKKYLDFFTFFASFPIGFNHPALNNEEFIKKIGKCAIHKPSNSDIYTEEMAEFVDTFGKYVKPEYMKYLFFVSGGALAVENALKAAFDWKVRKNLKKGKGEKGMQVIHFKNAFHGRSGYTLSLTNTFDPRKTQYFPKFNWPRISTPYLHFPIDQNELKRVEEEEKKALKEIKDAIYKNKDDIACILIEPIQAEGGDNHFRKEFFKAIKDISLEEDILFIVDEVQSGMGLTGKWWAIDHFDVKPDIIAFGKKSQICGIMAGERIDEVEDNVFHESSRINSTWGGNFIDMIRATRIINVIVEENLVENAAKMGELFLSKLNEINNENISNIRGRGLMIAFDLKSTIQRDEIFDIMFQNGLFALKCGRLSIRFRPALNVNEQEINEAIEIIKKSAGQLK